MTRLLSGLVLTAVILGAVWYAPAWLLLLIVEVIVVAAVIEYAGLMDRCGASLPRPIAIAAAMLSCAAVAWPGLPAAPMLIGVVLAVLLAVLLGSQPAPQVPAVAAATLFPALYLGVPLALAVVIREAWGREVLLLGLAVVWASDTAQYYVGSSLGRHRLAPAISPKKSVEGAAGGFAAGIAVMVGLGRLWLPGVDAPHLVAIGTVLAGLGIGGDLFESLLKRSADVKDSSGLIPGHGGVLDRIDAQLFVLPGYYLVLRLIA